MKHIILFFIFLQSVLITILSVSTPFAEERLKSVEEMFGSRYTEGDYYRTERNLLTATGHLMETRKAPAIATVITAEEIRNMGARTIKDVLRMIPGFSIGQIPASAEGYFVGVRGVVTNMSEKILLLIDGNKMNDPYQQSWARDVFPDLMIENIKRIEIVRGPGSALYGTNAFVAVINVITKSAEDIGGQQFSVSAGSFDTRHYNGLFSHQDKGFQVSGHMDFYETDGYGYLIEEDALSVAGNPASLAPGETINFVNKWDVGLKMKYNDLSVNLRMIDKKNGPYIGFSEALNDESVRKIQQTFGTIIYEKKITDDLDISLNLHANHYELDPFWELFPEGFTGGNDVGLLGDPFLKTITYSSEITSNYTFGDHLLTGGVYYEYADQYEVRLHNNFSNPFSGMVDVSDSNNFNQEATRKVWALYLQDMWEITAYDSLTVGIRHDQYSDFGGTTNPRIGYVHEFKNELALKFLYGSAFRAPSFVELYTINNPVFEGNPDLDPETINTFEAGMEYPFRRYFTLKLNYFHNELKDIIKPDPFLPLPTIVNINGKSEIEGVECELDFRFSKDKYGYINCSYQDGEDERGNTLPQMARFQANTGVNYGPFFRYLNANVNVSWIGKRTRSVEDSRDKADSYALTDLTLIARNFYKTFEVMGSVHNLFDVDARDPSWDEEIPNDLPTNKRMFLMELRYRF